MIDLSPLSLPDITRFYLLANTPMYLYRQFRRTPSVHALAQANNVSDLVDHICRVDASEIRTPSDIAGAYAAVMALTYCDPREVKESVSSKKIENLEWFDDLLEIWKSHSIITETTTERYKPRLRERQPWSEGTSSRSVIDLSGGGK